MRTRSHGFTAAPSTCHSPYSRALSPSTSLCAGPNRRLKSSTALGQRLMNRLTAGFFGFLASAGGGWPPVGIERRNDPAGFGCVVALLHAAPHARPEPDVVSAQEAVADDAVLPR